MKITIEAKKGEDFPDDDSFIGEEKFIANLLQVTRKRLQLRKKDEVTVKVIH